MFTFEYKENILYVFNNKKLFQTQPHWPDGTKWANKIEAENWAKLLIKSLKNPNSEFVPGDSPDKPQKTRGPKGDLDPLTGEYVSPDELQKRYEQRLADGLDPETGEPFSDTEA